MLTAATRTAHPLKIVAALLLALAALAGLLASGASARAAGPGQIVFVAGKGKVCRMGACHNFDLVRSISPHGGPGRVLAKVRSVAETASTEDGTVAVLSKNIAGGGANSAAYTQVYLISPSGKRTEVFRHRLEDFAATGMGISGDGRTIALSARYKDQGGLSKIWVVRSNGTGMHQVTTGPGNDEMPAISPDGKRIVFSRTLVEKDVPGSRKPELWSVDVESGEETRLTENALEDVNPVFSPDGRSIAFGQVAAHNRGGVDVIRADGSGLRKVTSTGREYPDPDYAPSGRSIAFIGEVPHAPGGYTTAIYTVRTSGTGRTLASSRFEFPELPQWTLR
jgi:Tol biopolymer transport system component